MIDSRNFEAVSANSAAQNLTKLEGDFNKYFKIQTDYNRQSQAITLLAPDIMTFLIDNMQECDMEFVSNKLYFYFPPVWDSQRNFLHYYRRPNLESLTKSVWQYKTDPNNYKKETLSGSEKYNQSFGEIIQGTQVVQKNITIAQNFLFNFEDRIKYIKK